MSKHSKTDRIATLRAAYLAAQDVADDANATPEQIAAYYAAGREYRLAAHGGNLHHAKRTKRAAEFDELRAAELSILGCPFGSR